MHVDGTEHNRELVQIIDWLLNPAAFNLSRKNRGCKKRDYLIAPAGTVNWLENEVKWFIKVPSAVIVSDWSTYLLSINPDQNGQDSDAEAFVFESDVLIGKIVEIRDSQFLSETFVGAGEHTMFDSEGGTVFAFDEELK